MSNVTQEKQDFDYQAWTKKVLDEAKLINDDPHHYFEQNTKDSVKELAPAFLQFLFKDWALMDV